jgi:hypothetical protein
VIDQRKRVLRYAAALFCFIFEVEKVAGTVWIAELQNSWHCQAVIDADGNILAWIVYANKVKKKW